MSLTLEDLHDEETRVTDDATGGEKGAKLNQQGALDPVALIELSRVAGMGANKYAAFNYLKGYDWALSYNAMMRHAMLFWAGEDIDAESGRPHMAHAAWNALALVSFLARGIGTDTRPPSLRPGVFESTLRRFNEGLITPGQALVELGIDPPIEDVTTVDDDHPFLPEGRYHHRIFGDVHEFTAVHE